MTNSCCAFRKATIGPFFWLLVVAPYAGAVTGDTKPLAIFDTAYLIQVFGSLLFVCACLFGLLFVLKKMNGLPTTDRKLIQILGSVKVGSREKIVLLKAGEDQLLVGVAAGSVRTLHVFENLDLENDSASDKTLTNFADVLKASSNLQGKK